MRWTQDWLDALREAYATGASSVTYQGRTIAYDRARMKAMIAEGEAQLEGSSGSGATPSRTSYATFRRD